MPEEVLEQEQISENMEVVEKVSVTLNEKCKILIVLAFTLTILTIILPWHISNTGKGERILLFPWGCIKTFKGGISFLHIVKTPYNISIKAPYTLTIILLALLGISTFIAVADRDIPLREKITSITLIIAAVVNIMLNLKYIESLIKISVTLGITPKTSIGTIISQVLTTLLIAMSIYIPKGIKADIKIESE